VGDRRFWLRVSAPTLSAQYAEKGGAPGLSCDSMTTLASQLLFSLCCRASYHRAISTRLWNPSLS
jgi:hypothetical protein